MFKSNSNLWGKRIPLIIKNKGKTAVIGPLNTKVENKKKVLPISLGLG